MRSNLFHLILLSGLAISHSLLQVQESICSNRLTADECLQSAIRIDENGHQNQISCFYCGDEPLSMNSSVRCFEAEKDCDYYTTCGQMNFFSSSQNELIDLFPINYGLLNPTLFGIRQLIVVVAFGLAFCYFSNNKENRWSKTIAATFVVGIVDGSVQGMIYSSFYPPTPKDVLKLCNIYPTIHTGYVLFWLVMYVFLGLFEVIGVAVLMFLVCEAYAYTMGYLCSIIRRRSFADTYTEQYAVSQRILWIPAIALWLAPRLCTAIIVLIMTDIICLLAILLIFPLICIAGVLLCGALLVGLPLYGVYCLSLSISHYLNHERENNILLPSFSS